MWRDEPIRAECEKEGPEIPPACHPPGESPPRGLRPLPEIQLKIAVWTNDKSYNYNLLHKDLRLEARVEALEKALLQARTWLDAPSSRSELETLRIFIAPENILVDAKPLEQSREKASAVSFEAFKVFCQQDKLEGVCTGILPALSKGLLFIPGTVLQPPVIVGREQAQAGALVHAQEDGEHREIVEGVRRPGGGPVEDQVEAEARPRGTPTPSRRRE